MIKQVYATEGGVEILDIGGTEAYWRIVPEDFFADFRIRVTLLNLSPPTSPEPDERFIVRTGDAAGDLWSEIDPSAYHLLHSNSVIEHVGNWARMVRFAENIKAFSGDYFVQTPNFWFPIEPHFMTPFFHWLPKPVRVSLVQNMSLGNWERAANVRRAVEIVESSDLLSESMFSELFGDAEIHKEKALFLTKSLIAIRSSR